ncbi:hypothetical protein WN51_06027 [Melipona quadrifasciata]|uniref:Uncharacterized protein n=1 Tax=Melipona quadrifasciata TaxID=166423 RepID=A0A0M8ZUL6_9HYME|nr:hypothetical protein WN51_06027 [Melipona quadrifasciata]
MSYVEHGPRIFLANKRNSGTPLIYGDYVLPKKRLEGRLKLHDSCSDIRAWSPNSLENSRYFRELNEHDSSVLQELLQKNSYTTRVSKDIFSNISKSGSMIQSNSLSIHVPCGRNVSTITKQYNQYSYSLTTFDPSLKNYNFIPSCKSIIKSLPAAGNVIQRKIFKIPNFLNFNLYINFVDYDEKTSFWLEYIDVAVQAKTEMHDVEIQVNDEVDKYPNKIITISAMSQTSFTSKSSDKDNSAIDLDKNNSQKSNVEEQSFECDASCSSQDIESLTESDTEMGTESDLDLHNSIHKGIIIQKDSEIIVLKNELCVKDVELEELSAINKYLESLLIEKENCMYTQQVNLYSYKYLVEQLKQDLNEKCESCYLYSEEIKKLQSCVKETTTLQLEKESLLVSNYTSNNILYNISIIITRFQSYKIESQNLLQQIGDLKHIGNDKQEIYFNQNLKYMIYEKFHYGSEMDLNNTKKEIIEYFTHFLIKLRSLTQKLQIYVEIERPVMIKQTYYFHEILKNTQSAINVSQDVTLKKKLVSQLYNQHKEEHKKRNSYIKQLPIMNTEIKHPKEIKHLIQENADLRATLKSQMEEYQNKLILMKKNYDSSLNAHKANSLNMKELIELHRRITVIVNSNTNIIHMQNENQCLYANKWHFIDLNDSSLEHNFR